MSRRRAANLEYDLSGQDTTKLPLRLLRLNSQAGMDRRKQMVEDEIAKASCNNERMKLLLTIPGINVYFAAAIISEIDDIRRFNNKEKLASYAGLVRRQSQS